mmetsp:Transcript_24011/g.38697  ORF Transcript_24011/g.38697 Transcript_24011/m.38697 type:complete len:223 (-) Transcript_24011:91-759(-)
MVDESLHRFDVGLLHLRNREVGPVPRRSEKTIGTEHELECPARGAGYLLRIHAFARFRAMVHRLDDAISGSVLPDVAVIVLHGIRSVAVVADDFAHKDAMLVPKLSANALPSGKLGLDSCQIDFTGLRLGVSYNIRKGRHSSRFLLAFLSFLGLLNPSLFCLAAPSALETSNTSANETITKSTTTFITTARKWVRSAATPKSATAAAAGTKRERGGLSHVLL